MVLWPTPGEVHVELLGDLQGENLKMKIYDMTGMVIEERTIDLDSQNKFSLDMDYLRPGMYLVELWNDYHQFSEKIIVK
jgi:hypothetical protein